MGRTLSKHIIGMYASLNIIKKDWHEALKFFHRLKNSSNVNIPPTSKQWLHLWSVSHVGYSLLCQLTLQEESSWSSHRQQALVCLAHLLFMDFAAYCYYLRRQCRSQCQTQRSPPEIWIYGLKTI